MITRLEPLLEKGDLVIDGGNSRFTEDFKHAEQLAPKGIDFMDAGVSGGVWGLENGYGLMVGGSAEQVERVMPVFDALRPRVRATRASSTSGEVGAGHYAKMVHNGIEYALMQAYAEGYELLDTRKDIIKDVTGTFKAWQRGTVVRSWLLELLVRALEQDPEFEDIEGYVEDSGEGRWTVEEALDERGAGPDDQRVDLRPLRLAPGGLAGDEGRRRAAQPVRRPRRQGEEAVRTASA